MAVLRAQRDLTTFEEAKDNGFFGSMAQRQDSSASEASGTVSRSLDSLFQSRLQKEEGTSLGSNMGPRPPVSPAAGQTLPSYSKDLPAGVGGAPWQFMHGLPPSGIQSGHLPRVYPNFYSGTPFPHAFGGMLTEEVLRAFKRSFESGSESSSSKLPENVPESKVKSDEKEEMKWSEKQEWNDKQNVLPWLDDRLPPMGEGISSLLVKSNPLEARLQEMLHRTMDRYAHQALDTLAISRAVRELLSQHNIGQRLFAKWVLGLSQGTVSELLSKPKNWDKLTEKGRDSYRKMHAWACDGGAVRLLKALLPRKAQQGSSLKSLSPVSAERVDNSKSPCCSSLTDRLRRKDSFVGSPEDGASKDERIAQILSEAQTVLRVQSNGVQNEETSHSDGSTKSPEPRRNSPSPSDKDEESIRGVSKQEEVAMNRASKDEEPTKSEVNQLHESRAEAPAVLSLESYHQELAKFLTSQQMAREDNRVQDLSLPRRYDDEKSLGKCEMKKEMSGTPSPSFSHRSLATSGILQPGASPMSDDVIDSSNVASPLQRIASITNSLMSQPPPPVMSQSSQRPMKAVLPPITQQQFDAYQTLNTEEIVKKVKEVLSQYSISQRLFGEAVLGLSQGSVSDLLARPKPWHMLTQKGREPFIRMKLFLDDETAIHRLVASQYKVAPERLMRTAGFGNSPQSVNKFPPRAPTTSPSTRPLGTNSLRNRWGETPHDLPLSLGFPFGLPPGYPSHIPSQFFPMMNRDAPLSKRESTPIKEESGRSSTTPGCPPDVGFEPMVPAQNIYEIAALTPDLDTQMVTSRVKEVLLANNIGQKLFGEVVLGLSQGSVSELLSKPKPWPMLSVKGREPFVRMHLWLSDQRNVTRLHQIKVERRDRARKRGADGQTDNEALNSPGETSGSDSSDDEAREKRARLALTPEQKDALLLAFNLDPYPAPGGLEVLAKDLGIPPKTISNWFHNHRMRLKQASEENPLPGHPMFSPFMQHSPNPELEALRYRMMLGQRLFELQGQAELAKAPVVPPFQPPFYGAGYSPEMLYMLYNMQGATPGLDLRVTNHKPESPPRGSDDECHSDITPPSSPIGRKEPSRVADQPCAGSSRRKRKSAAPQWVNPAYLRDEEDSDSDEIRKRAREDGAQFENGSTRDITINGHCVLKSEPKDLTLNKDENCNTETVSDRILSEQKSEL